MNTQQLKYFLALADELHFWNTASKMNITQSALSRQIQSLESELGLQLFYRDKRNVSLTPAGKFLQEKWSKELSELESLHRMAKQIHLGEYGTIKIAYPDSISSSVLPDFVRNIYAAYPGLKLNLIQLPYELQEEFLIHYKTDLVFSRDINGSAAIHSRKLTPENLCLAVPENHHFYTLSDISEASLRCEKLILTTEQQSSSYNTLIQEVFRFYAIQPDSYIRCEFGSTIISLIKSGLGISVLPQSYELRETRGVRFIPLPFTADLYVNWRKDDPNPVLQNILRLI